MVNKGKSPDKLTTTEDKLNLRTKLSSDLTSLQDLVGRLIEQKRKQALTSTPAIKHKLGGQSRFGLKRSTTARPDIWDSIFIQKLIESTQPQLNTQHHGLGSGQMGSLPTKMLNSQEGIVNNELVEIRHKFAPMAFRPDATTSRTTSDIPKHLIPLGPDGKPLFNHDGTQSASSVGICAPQSMAGDDASTNSDTDFKTTTTSPTTTESQPTEEGGFLTNMLNSIRNMPFQTRRQMFAR